MNGNYMYDTSKMNKVKRVKKHGSEGSISLYYQGLMVSTLPLTKKKTFDYYRKNGEDSIIRHFKEGYSLKKQIAISRTFCEVFTYRRASGQKVAKEDHIMMCQALFVLLKTKVIDNDELNGYLIMPNCRHKRKNHVFKH